MHLIIVLHLVSALYQRAAQLPDVNNQQVAAFVMAAVQEETRDAPATLLIALAWAESRFDPNAQPMCGALQVRPVDLGRPQSDCVVWRKSVRAGVRAGVDELKLLLADRRVRRNMRRALMYRACGNAFFEGTCSDAKARWVDTAIVRWKWLEESYTGIGS